MSALRRFAFVWTLLGSLTLLAAAGATTVPGAHADGRRGLVEVVVTLPQPPLAAAVARDRQLARAVTRNRKLNIRTPAAVRYLRLLAAAQRSLQARIQTAIPEARVRWHYGVVLNGIAVVVPRSQLSRLQSVPGATVWPSVTYHALLNRSPQLIGAPAVWGAGLSTAGNGMKIGIIDDGVDQTHLFFDPTGYSCPPGFPKGNTAFTTPKVIVAKAFPPASASSKYANAPFDPDNSDHATHVAGIAAGNHDTPASSSGGARVHVSGVAPHAYIGNYKVLTVPTPGFGLDGNSPEIVKGIEEAVKDGMDVLNLSLGEPEIENSRDIVVAAINGAAEAGVIPVVSAGNDYTIAGRGSIGSPGTAVDAITVAASTDGSSGPADVVAGFSSSGPTPTSLQLKPDLTAPGVDILSSVPGNRWEEIGGTSMSAPHVAGAAAVLKERHPAWTPAQIKSALASTAVPVHAPGSPSEVSVLREGGGRIDLGRADNPLVFVNPISIALGFVRPGTTAAGQVVVDDAGGGPAPWTASIDTQATPHGVALSLSSPTIATGSALTLTATAATDAAEGDAAGFVLLTRGSDVRRVPYWLHVASPKLAGERHGTILRPGIYGGTTAGKPSLVSSYRYPEGGLACNCKTGVPLDLSGPEAVFRFTVKQPLANFGAVVLSHAKGVQVTPRLVVAGDENRLVGFTGLPVNINPYQAYGRVQPIVGAVLPAPGSYDFVFDTPAGGKPGKFTFRVWADDVTPPLVRLVTRTVAAGAPIRLVVTDGGAGVDPSSLAVTVDDRKRVFTFARGVLRLSAGGLTRGPHRLRLIVSDYQEPKNMENAGPILPNTRTFTATVAVR